MDMQSLEPDPRRALDQLEQNGPAFFDPELARLPAHTQCGLLRHVGRVYPQQNIRGLVRRKRAIQSRRRN